MDASISTYSKGSVSLREDRRPETLRLVWEFDECTDRTVRAFGRIRERVENSDATWVILDMSKCRYISVAGLRCLLEWSERLSSVGIIARISGLTSLLKSIFILARLEWILETK